MCHVVSVGEPTDGVVGANLNSHVPLGTRSREIDPSLISSCMFCIEIVAQPGGSVPSVWRITLGGKLRDTLAMVVVRASAAICAASSALVNVSGFMFLGSY